MIVTYSLHVMIRFGIWNYSCLEQRCDPLKTPDERYRSDLSLVT